MSTSPNGKRTWPDTTAAVIFVLMLLSIIPAVVLPRLNIFEWIDAIVLVCTPLSLLSGIASIVALCMGKHRVRSLVMLVLALAYFGWLSWVLLD